MGLFGDLLGIKRFKDPVRGFAQVVGASMPPHATHGTLTATLVVQADGVASTPVQHRCMAPVAKWPSVGETLPVTVDRERPDRIRIEWDEVRTAADESWERAQAIASDDGPGGFGPSFGTVVSTHSTTVNLTDGMSDDERRTLETFGIDADALASGAEAMRAAFGVPQGGAAGLPGATPPAGDLTGELARLASLHSSGALTDEEFAAAKARLLGTGPG